MWPFVTKAEIEELRERIEALEGGKDSIDDDTYLCIQCGIRLIETTSLVAPNRTKMCPKCGTGYGYPHLETR